MLSIKYLRGVSLLFLQGQQKSNFFAVFSCFSAIFTFSLICSKSENLEFRKISRLVRSLASILEPYSISCILVKFRVSSTHIPDISNVAEIEKVIKNLKTSAGYVASGGPDSVKNDPKTSKVRKSVQKLRKVLQKTQKC